MPSAIYPISASISELMREYSCDEKEFVIQVLGYHHNNVDKGVRHLRSWIDTGSGPASIIKGLCWATQRGGELREAIAASERVKRDEAEVAFRKKCEAEADTFRPYIHVVGETGIPNGVTLFGVTGGRWNYIEIPSRILELALEEQLSAVTSLMEGYLRRLDGQCPFFGKVTGFLFVRLLDHFSFGNRGIMIDYVNRPFRRGEGVCSLR